MSRAYFELVRIPAVFTAPSDVLAGAALALVAGAAMDPLGLAVGVLASAAIYCAGMAANDLFDVAIDRVERPGRPIPSGRISVGAAWRLVLGLQIAALGVAALGGGLLVAAVGATILATYLYNGLLKDTVVGPFAMGACRYTNALIGAAALGGLAGPALWVPIGTLVYTAAVTWLSRFEVDGASSAAVRRPATAMILTSLAPAVGFATGALPQLWAAPLVILPALWLSRPLHAAIGAGHAGAVRGGVMAGIYGIALCNGVIAAGCGAWALAAIAVGLLVPGKRFGRWFYAT